MVHQKKFQCFENKSDIRINGDYNSDKASQINVQLVRCDKNNTKGVVCKSDEEITTWLRGKYFLFMYN